MGLAALLLLALAGLAGCGVQQLVRGEVQPPQVAFQGLRVGLPTAQGWPLAATLLVENPNAQNLEVLGYDYDLWLQGRSVLRGESRQAVTLPARGQVLVDVPMVLQTQAIPMLATAVLGKQNLLYQISGGFRLGSLLGGLFRVPFSFQGQITAQQALERLRDYVH
jgi:LEA14-like dessication related protein